MQDAPPADAVPAFFSFPALELQNNKSAAFFESNRFAIEAILIGIGTMNAQIVCPTAEDELMVTLKIIYDKMFARYGRMSPTQASDILVRLALPIGDQLYDDYCATHRQSHQRLAEAGQPLPEFLKCNLLRDGCMSRAHDILRCVELYDQKCPGLDQTFRDMCTTIDLHLSRFMTKVSSQKCQSLAYAGAATSSTPRLSTISLSAVDQFNQFTDFQKFQAAAFAGAAVSNVCLNGESHIFPPVAVTTVTKNNNFHQTNSFSSRRPRRNKPQSLITTNSKLNTSAIAGAATVEHQYW